MGNSDPIFGAFAEKLGDRKAIFLGVLIYALGLALSSIATTASGHQMLEILVGVGVAGTGFGVVLGVVGRAAPDEHRIARVRNHYRCRECGSDNWSATDSSIFYIPWPGRMCFCFILV